MSPSATPPRTRDAKPIPGLPSIIGRLFDRGVVLRMGTREIRATSTHALRSDLTGHASVSSVRIAELGKLTDRDLAAHATGIATLTANLSTTLASHNCDPHEVLAQVHRADAPIDPAWADAIEQVSIWPAARSGYLRALLDALLEYLASERDLLRTLLENRQRVSFDGQSNAGVGGAMLSVGEPEELHQRLIFDVGDDDTRLNEALQFNRLTKGEPLDITMSAGQCVQIVLAQHRFALICGSPWRLVDEYGEDLRLSPLRCVAGRSNECDLTVHESFRAISRRHVVFETQGTELVRITDISSLGTFMPGDSVTVTGRVH